jgi:hypothetical protein
MKRTHRLTATDSPHTVTHEITEVLRFDEPFGMRKGI